MYNKGPAFILPEKDVHLTCCFQVPPEATKHCSLQLFVKCWVICLCRCWEHRVKMGTKIRSFVETMLGICRALCAWSNVQLKERSAEKSRILSVNSACSCLAEY